MALVGDYGSAASKRVDRFWLRGFRRHGFQPDLTPNEVASEI